jgi:hypothetical protein
MGFYENQRRRRREIKVETIDEVEGTVWVISTSYQKGGINYFNYAHEVSGYYVSVRREKRTREAVGVVSQFGMFDSVKALLEPSDRFSKKRLDQLEPSPELLERLKAHVTKEHAASEGRRAGAFKVEVEADKQPAAPCNSVDAPR